MPTCKKREKSTITRREKGKLKLEPWNTYTLRVHELVYTYTELHKTSDKYQTDKDTYKLYIKLLKRNAQYVRENVKEMKYLPSLKTAVSNKTERRKLERKTVFRTLRKIRGKVEKLT